MKQNDSNFFFKEISIVNTLKNRLKKSNCKVYQEWIVHVKTINGNNFFWKTTIIYLKVLYLILNVLVSIQFFILNLNFLTCINLHMIEKLLLKINNKILVTILSPHNTLPQ